MQRVSKTCVVWSAAIILVLAAGGCGDSKDWDANAWNPQTWWDDESAASAEAGAGELPEIDTSRPPSAQTLYSLAKILAAQGKDAECQLVLVRCVTDHPNFMPAYCDLAELHVRNNQVGEAIVTLRTGLAVSPDDSVLMNNLGMCWLLRGDYQEALTQFTNAAAAANNDVRYRANMAAALGMLGRYDEAEALFGQILSQEDVKHNLAIIREARGEGQASAGDTPTAPQEPAVDGAEDQTLSVAPAIPAFHPVAPSLAVEELAQSTNH